MNKIIIDSEKEVAYDSPDHIQPHGTKQDNSTNSKFNEKLGWWLPPDMMRVLDIGCSGGGFVKSVIDGGGFAVGIEGSDYSKKHQRAEWATIPGSLFTTDATARYQLYEVQDDGTQTPLKFDVVTAWEFIEHIKEEDLPKVFENIDRHLNQNGVVIMSASPNEEVINGVVLHQCVHDANWWYAKLKDLGFTNHILAVNYFGNDMIRGGDNAPNSFHVVLTRNEERLLHSSGMSDLVMNEILNKLLDEQRGIRKEVRRLSTLVKIPLIAGTIVALVVLVILSGSKGSNEENVQEAEPSKSTHEKKK